MPLKPFSFQVRIGIRIQRQRMSTWMVKGLLIVRSMRVLILILILVLVWLGDATLVRIEFRSVDRVGLGSPASHRHQVSDCCNVSWERLARVAWRGCVIGRCTVTFLEESEETFGGSSRCETRVSSSRGTMGLEGEECLKKYKRYSERRADELSFTWIARLATCFDGSDDSRLIKMMMSLMDHN